MQSNTSNGFSIWAKIGLPHTYFRENYPDLDEDSQLLKIKLATLWDNLSKRERKYWRQQARLVSNHWIRDNVVKRCGSHYKWEDGTVLLAKCDHDGLWYLVDEQYRKGSHVEGDWPKKNGKDAPQYEVAIKVKWTDDGLRLVFKT
jgi:hypothetical protein